VWRDLLSTDVTVSLSGRDKVETHNGTLAFPVVTFGDHDLTYPALGIPLPSIATFGFRKSIRVGGVMNDDSSLGYIFKYDRTNHKIRMWRSSGSAAALAEHGSAGVVPVTLTLKMWGN